MVNDGYLLLELKFLVMYLIVVLPVSGLYVTAWYILCLKTATKPTQFFNFLLTFFLVNLSKI